MLYYPHQETTICFEVPVRLKKHSLCSPLSSNNLVPAGFTGNKDLFQFFFKVPFRLLKEVFE